MYLHFLLQILYNLKINFLLVILLVLVIFPAIVFLRQRRESADMRKLPPGPPRLPLIGNLHQLRDLPHRSLHQLSLKYGPLMFLQLGSKPTLVISSAGMVEEIFKNHDLIFSDRPISYAAKRLTYECLDVAFTPYGEYWREIRKIAVLELLSIKKVQSFETVRKEEVDLMISLIASSQSPINVSETLLHLVNNIICRVSFGRKYKEENNGKRGLHTLLLETQELFGGFSVADFFPWLWWVHRIDGLESKLSRNFRELDEFYDEIIEEHLNPSRPKPEVEDLVDVLLRVQRDPSRKVIHSTDRVKAVLTDMFIAGTDTSSATLVWAMTELIRNPVVMKKAQDEVREVVGKKEIVEEGDLPQLNYLKLVVKEALRLHPPAPLLVPRETRETCTVEGYKIPAKTRVFINAKSVATDPKSWENPEDFSPERFLRNPLDFRGQDFEFIPFGIGRRGCPGINFSVVLIELVLANLIHCFSWELPQGVKTEDMDMNEAFGVTMHKKIPLCLVAVKRQNTN
ncbi:hypothetical protein ACHQM5_001018 [Ranunculus cassubicifolius]